MEDRNRERGGETVNEYRENRGRNKEERAKRKGIRYGEKE
jgi:hypothetical protein